MLLIIFVLILAHCANSEDICDSINCGSGICITTTNPTLPYYCHCSNGFNTILPCPSENPCLRNPCGLGTCEHLPKLLYGYLCRCPGDVISLTSCNVTQSTCATNPCVNGLCIEGVTSFICNCLPTWTGRTCNEKIDSSCANNICGSGKCFPVDDLSLPYICLCPNGQFSVSCQSMVYAPSIAPRMLTTISPASDACNRMNSRGCLNGGQCLPTIDGYQCYCTAGFTGRFCETRLDPCAVHPCLNGGICYNLGLSYMCSCPDGSFRSQCASDAVVPNTNGHVACSCKNGGTCTTLDSNPCTCANGYTGRFCEHAIASDKCVKIQCHNGGTCHESLSDLATTAYCLCKIGYTGKFCEVEYFRCQSNGRFADRYNCAKGKYFECVHYNSDGPNKNGALLSRVCPATLRFNILVDQCDYAANVQCVEN